MKNKKLILGSGVVLLLAAVFIIKVASGGGAAEIRKQNIPLVKIEKPARQTIVRTLQFTGDIVATQQASIFSQVGGNLEHVYVDMGAAVKRNQLLAVIDSTELYQQVQQTRATYYNAKMTYDRTRQLLEQKLVAQQDLDNSDALMKVADANYATAKTRLGYARIAAPFAGYITKRYLDAGALVSTNNSVLFMLMDLDNVKVVINVLEKDIPAIVIGKKSSLSVDAFPDKHFEGTVMRISQAVDPATRTMAVEVIVPNADHLLKPGMFATAFLAVDEHPNALTVPTQAVLTDSHGNCVYITAANTAKRVSVVTGAEQGTRIEILSGLTGTEDLITTGQQFVKDGGPVSIQR